MKKISNLLMLFILTVMSAQAQTNDGIEMATTLRSSGKIYVVVLVIVLIFIALSAYLFSIDRKVSKLYKNQKNQS